MTTLVTGAAGFLGSHVARQLVARGDEVRVLLRASSTNRAIADLSLEYVTGDLRDPASLDRAMKDVKRVFHVAADYAYGPDAPARFTIRTSVERKIFWRPRSAPASSS